MPSLLGHKGDKLVVSVTKLLDGISPMAINTLLGCSGFMTAVRGLLAITSTTQGQQAAKILSEIGGHINIMAVQAQIDVSLKYQSQFAQHVYEFAAIRIDDTTNETIPKGQLKIAHVFILYHPATDW